MSGDIKVPLADLESDMGSWVSALFDVDPCVTLVGATDSLTWREWLEKWARHNGVVARIRHCSDEEVSTKFAGMSDALLEVAAFLQEYGYTGGNPEAVYAESVSSSYLIPLNTTFH